MRKMILVAAVFCIFTSCYGTSIKEQFIENYFIIAGDDPSEAFLAYHVSRPVDSEESMLYGSIIGATVFAVGHNDKFIIAKQHPRTFPGPPDKSITNYYILPFLEGMDWETKNGLIGPLTLEEFNRKRNELEIDDSLTFTYVLEDLE